MCLKKIFHRKCKNQVIVGQYSKGSDKTLKGDEQTHWVDHICDEYVNADQKSAGGYANLHGFREGCEGNWTYWVGVDLRWCAIPIADVVIKCKTEKMYNKYINLVKHGNQFHTGPSLIAQAVREDPDLWCRNGDDVDTEFIFRWGDKDKDFDVYLSGDRYAEEK